MTLHFCFLFFCFYSCTTKTLMPSNVKADQSATLLKQWKESAHKALIVPPNQVSKHSSCSTSTPRPLYEPVLFFRHSKVTQVFSLISLAKRKQSPLPTTLNSYSIFQTQGEKGRGFNLLIQRSHLERALFFKVWVGRMSPSDQTVAPLEPVTSSIRISLN